MFMNILAAIAALMLISGSAAGAQEYPTKVITMVVPFAAGGPTDTVARLIAQPMGKTLKQQVIVENVGGAGGTIAANRVAEAAADVDADVEAVPVAVSLTNAVHVTSWPTASEDGAHVTTVVVDRVPTVTVLLLPLVLAL